MKKVVLFEPSISTLNLGDYIIVEAVKKELGFLLNKAFVVEQSTQTPVMHFYQKKGTRMIRTRDADYKFVCGSNLIWQNMWKANPQWNHNIFNCANQIGSILVAVGSCTTLEKLNLYSRTLYRKVLNKDYIHSVRDEATKNRLESIGIKCINTGCITTWGLNAEHCKKIPKNKADKVVFTLTDYCQDEDKDKKMVEILLKNYKEVYFWPQGAYDYDYIEKLGYLDRVKILPAKIEAMRSLLQAGSIDYVGTRLHGGIFAMQYFVRSIILIIDNRAREMRENYNLPTVERENVEELDELINSSWETSININTEAINAWKKQFEI